MANDRLATVKDEAGVSQGLILDHQNGQRVAMTGSAVTSAGLNSPLGWVKNLGPGTVYLRGQGAGQVRAVHGLDALPPEVASLVVDSRLPRAGQPSSGSYEGDGYITIRHPETEVVTAALKTLVSTVRVELG